MEIPVGLRRQRETPTMPKDMTNPGHFMISLIAQRYISLEESRLDLAATLLHETKCKGYMDKAGRRKMVMVPGGECVEPPPQGAGPPSAAPSPRHPSERL